MVSLMPVEPFKTILEAYGMHDFCTGPEGVILKSGPVHKRWWFNSDGPAQRYDDRWLTWSNPIVSYFLTDESSSLFIHSRLLRIT